MKKYLMSALMLGITMNAAACSDEKASSDYEIPPHITIDNSKKEGVTRLAAYNVGVFNKYTPDCYQMIADMMKELDADAVCLNELDSCTTRTRGVYQLKHVAQLMGNWDYQYGCAMPYNGGKYGEGIMTSKPAVTKFQVALPKGVGAEPRVMAVMELEDYVIATTHLDHVSAEAQLGQVEVIVKVLKEKYGKSPKPVFFGGDLNATPGSTTIKELEKEFTTLSITGLGTFPSSTPTKCIDFIMQLNNGVKCELIGSQVPRWFKTGDVTKASDHLPIMIDVKLPAKK